MSTSSSLARGISTPRGENRLPKTTNCLPMMSNAPCAAQEIRHQLMIKALRRCKTTRQCLAQAKVHFMIQRIQKVELEGKICPKSSRQSAPKAKLRRKAGSNNASSQVMQHALQPPSKPQRPPRHQLPSTDRIRKPTAW